MGDDVQGVQMSDDALGEWRRAEQTAAVTRRGRVAAEVAASAAAEAATAALATAAAARAAVAAAALAESSASKTAAAAWLAAVSSNADLADQTAESSLADFEETEARRAYLEAAGRAAERMERGPSGR